MRISWQFRFLVALLVLATSALAQQRPPVEWITLGTAGGPVIHANQAQTANALLIGNDVYIFDVGYGALRQLAAAKVPLGNIRAVFISHHHFDHNADLGALLLSEWLFGSGKPIGVFGPPGTTTLVTGLAAANSPTAAASFPVSGPAKPALSSVFRASDLSPVLVEPTLVYSDANVRVTAISVNHFELPPSTPVPDFPHAVAYRVEAAGRSYVFSGDTGPSDNLRKLAKSADILITEVVDLGAIEAFLKRIMKDAPARTIETLVANMKKNHSTPEVIGTLASEAGVKEVILTHFVPGFADNADVTNFTRGIAPAYRGPVFLAHDLEHF